MTTLQDTTLAGRATHGRVPLFRPYLNGVPFDISVSEAAFVLTEGGHDSATISVTSPTLVDTTGILNSAISFVYGTSPKTEVFTGYVTAVKENDQTTTGSLAFQIHVMGATKVMQVGMPRFFVNCAAPLAVKQLVAAASLGYTGHEQTYLWPVLAQVDETDWKYINNLAKRSGWGIYNRYGVVMCYDPLKLFQESGAVATLVSDAFVIADPFTERNLLEFTPQEEASTSLNNAGIKVAYFSGETVQVAVQKGAFDSYRFSPDLVIRNAEEAAIYVNSADSTTADWPQQASARLLGNANLFPGMCVDVMTVASQAKLSRNRYNGRWFIRAVQHKMDRQQFQTLVLLCRPSANTPVSANGGGTFWGGRPKPVMSLIENQWVSSWKGVSV